MTSESSSATSEKTQIVIVSKSGSLSQCVVETNKETTLDELTAILSKKCGNKKSDGFSCYHTYKYKNKSKSKSKSNKGTSSSASIIYIDVWCKTDGRAGQENKYELPPPIDEIIFFGNMALVARLDKQTACDISIELWNKIYEKLFGGFEDLEATAQEDENEIDELALIPACKKTANGYLKDGFVVDDSLGSGSAGSSDIDLGGKSIKKTGGGKKKKNTQKSDSTTESECITETDTETDSISESEIRSESSSESLSETATATATTTVTASATATATAITNRKITPLIKKASVTKKPSKPTKKDELASAAAAAAAVAAILGDSSDSELSEESYSP